MTQQIKKERESNLELLRIITMLAIVAHHYVVNSGVTNQFDLASVNANTLFLQLWGMWGKTGINIFVLISGYFMCRSKLTLNRYLKVFSEAMFYRIVIFTIFCFVGYETLSGSSILTLLFGFLKNIDNGFTSSFLMFYLFIPFINLLVNNMDKKMHQKLLVLLLFMYTLCGTFFFNSTVFSEVGWYITLYLVGAYIYCYPKKWSASVKVCTWLSIFTIVVAMLSVIVVDYVGVRYGFTNYYYMVNDSNKFLAFAVAVSVFLMFKNLNLGRNRIINTISSTTFGVFCIHASSNAMRRFLWQDLLKVNEVYHYSFGALVLHAFLSMIGIFVVCSIIDIIRIYLVERPFFKIISRK